MSQADGIVRWPNKMKAEAVTWKDEDHNFAGQAGRM